MNRKVTIPVIVAVTVALTAGVTFALYSGDGSAPSMFAVDANVAYPKSASEYFGWTHDVKRIQSAEELGNIVAASRMLGQQYNDPWGVTLESGGRIMAVPDVMMAEEALRPQSSRDQVATARPTGSASAGAPDHSGTNVQVAGVDEPDYVKNDARYVYVVSGDTLSIVDAYPAETAELVLRIALDIEYDNIENMFLSGDRLVIFYEGYIEKSVIPEFGFEPYETSSPATHALLVDVSDRGAPEILSDYTIEGRFGDARMINEYVYFVTDTFVGDVIEFPSILEGESRISPEAYYFDAPGILDSFNTIAVMDVNDGSISSETYLMGSAGTFYVSEDHFYLAYAQHGSFGPDTSQQQRFMDVIVPLLPADLQAKVRALAGDGAPWSEIEGLLQGAYNRMDDSQRVELFEEIEDAIDEYENRTIETVKTVIHKIRLDGQNTEYVARGEVPGQLLNQFSMDQEGDRFRIATTTESYTASGKFVRANAVYVLDGSMGMAGGLDGIAPNESIFSARFMGERLYLVTFERIDPFFVIDLSSDTPKILGELKIPGFSNYLHPYDADHIIGIGRDTIGNTGRVDGVKIALFDVRDVGSPRVAAEVVIGDDSVYSGALRDHKAFFFDGARGILSVPISGSTGAIDGVAGTGQEGSRWNGFYVFDISESAIDLRGKITHAHTGLHEYTEDNGRTFYIGDVLYTLSNSVIKMSDIGNLEGINSVKIKDTGKFIDILE